MLLGSGVAWAATRSPGFPKAIPKTNFPSPASAQTGLGPALDATNALLAAPWGGLSRQYASDAVAAIRKLEGRAIIDGRGSVNVLKWRVSLKLTNVGGSVDLAAPPGFRAASLTSAAGVAVEAPLNRFWRFGVGGKLAGRLSVKAGSTTLFDYSPPKPGLNLDISNFRLAASAQIDSTQVDRPRLTGAVIRPQLKVNGVPIALTATATYGKLSLVGPVAGLNVNLGSLKGTMNGRVAVSLIPQEPSYTVDFAPIFDTTGQLAVVTIDGKLAVSLKRVGKVQVPFSVPIQAFLLPEVGELTQLLRLQPPLPRDYGEGVPPSSLQTTLPSPLPDYGQQALDIENRIVSHVPFGAVLSIDAPIKAAKKSSYGLEADSSIWTGHYLAAESFRYATTGTPAALARVKDTVGGIKQLFDVTQDAVGFKKFSTAAALRPRVPIGTLPVTRRAPVTAGNGIFARTALPSTSKLDYTDGSLNRRGCWYEAPTGGWRLTVGGRTSKYRTYDALYKAFLGLKKKGAGATAAPLGTNWFGWGCGKDHAISRDQYIGVFMGLAYAHELVNDPTVRSQSAALIERMLDYLRKTNWNVVLPPDNRIQTYFLGNYDVQLAFLRIGATVNPGKYLPVYQRYAAASELTWVPTFFSSVEPIGGYFGFNLAQGVFGPTLLLEQDPGLRTNYTTAYNLLWRGVRHHKNAYFDLVHLLVQPPGSRSATAATPTSPSTSLPLSDEVKAVLNEWLVRLGEVRGPNGLPRNVVAEPAFQQGLYPDNLAGYTPLGGGQTCLSKFPLPVNGRIGDGMDFVWQRSPFGTGVPVANCGVGRPQPTQDDIARRGSDSRREGPGVDYLLAYWMGAYLGVVPKPAAGTG
ncbi:MAG: hypothetical protein QOK04_1758 [Solirubrobacteraceae bacterium]|nr:hypothetical protein [Solirubrobacteraceae bacterium]